ncbi:fatty acid desaturase [Bradyrhizobium sp. CCBAU 051011]|uniref:fatty acid desaturase n=1 Tax=Bradyrhizobium sp. CCBAU 051011 TaxID=858422 RepID=UPI00137439A6|nr:fatty acid desaturase [Bradyrhizobium sp. CCBAU 051011]QHO75525.1 fatty acid desaturase [Bradyrhizobium sp. CCBAU 051011]
MVLRSPETRALMHLLARYSEPNSARGVFELVITVVPFIVIWALMWVALDHGYWIGLLLVVPAAGFLVRLFMIQHDCGHGSFFFGRLANDWVGRAIGVVTLTPYDLWRRSHARHHASSGNLDRRGIGDIDTLTVHEFRSRPRWGQILYRLYRHPIVMFGVGPSYMFILQHRLPIGMMRGGWMPWLSAMSTNTAIAILVAAMIWLVGFGPFLLIHLPIMVLAASIGVWLFFVQHQFEDTSWSNEELWSFHDAALHGSSHYHLPAIFRWFTANIGVHHVHHLCSRIPCYRLPEVLWDHPELAAVGRITVFQSFRCVRMALWDEMGQRLISFEEAAKSVDRQPQMLYMSKLGLGRVKTPFPGKPVRSKNRLGLRPRSQPSAAWSRRCS